MVTSRTHDSPKTPQKQGSERNAPEPNKISASTPYDFNGKNLTPYGGLLPVITMLEKLGFQSLVEETLTAKRITHPLPQPVRIRAEHSAGPVPWVCTPEPVTLHRSRSDHLGHPESRRDAQSTFWRFVNAIHLNVARQLLTIVRIMRERVWAAANVKLETVTIDTDTTVHTLYGKQTGGRKSYNPKNKGKKSYQPMLTFLAETREYIWGQLRNGDRPAANRWATTSARCVRPCRRA